MYDIYSWWSDVECFKSLIFTERKCNENIKISDTVTYDMIC